VRDPWPAGPAVVLGVAIRLLSPNRRHWGWAMLAELGYLTGFRRRWRFAVDCALVAALYWRPSVTRRRLAILTIVLVGLGAEWWTYRTLLIAYPDGPAAAEAIIVLTGCVGAYAWLGALAVTGEASRAIVAWGVCAGFVLDLTWVATVTLWVTASADAALPPLQWPAVATALALPGLVGGWTARRARRERAGTHLGMWTGLVAGPTFAIGLNWVMDARNAFLAGAQDLSWSLVPTAAVDAILGLLFIPVACTLTAAIGAGLTVSWPWALASDAWRGVSAGPLLLLTALCSIAGPAGLGGQVEDLGYYGPIRAADSAAVSLDTTNGVNAVAPASPVDIGRSSDTFVIVFDRSARPIGGSVLVDGRPAVFPANVLLNRGEASGAFGPIPGQSMRLGEWPSQQWLSTQVGDATGVVAIQRWSGGYVVAGHSLQPRFDILSFCAVLLGLLVALMLVVNGRPGTVAIRLLPAEPT
jgi:hypothetical protein